MNNTQRFSNRVDNYVKYRPGYPPDVLHFLSETKGFNAHWTVADIGSGTGISTSLFLDNGNTVYAVEPNAPMRNKAEELLSSRPGFISIDGTAENTGLPSSSIDLIVAGQAFHWFNPLLTKKEFTRILRPGGAIALMWNERQKISDFEKEYEDLLQTYGTDYKNVNHSNITEKEIAAFFQPSPFLLKVADNRQTFDRERLLGRLLSSSYIPLEPADIYVRKTGLRQNIPRFPESSYICPSDNEPSVRFEKMVQRLKNIFDDYQQNGFVYFDYQTKVYIA